MILIDNFEIMDISDNFFDADEGSGLGEGGTHSSFCWWDFSETVSEKEIYMNIVMTKLGLPLKDYVGVEYWWSTRGVGDGLKIHQDKDEVLFKEEQVMVHPLMSIVTFPKESFVEGGDHYFVDEKFGTEPHDWVNFTESLYQRISYKHNRLIVLSPGNLFHGVLPIERGSRSAFVMNLWDRNLKGIW